MDAAYLHGIQVVEYARIKYLLPFCDVIQNYEIYPEINMENQE